jgi:predicted PurR-regulated permease PerM
MLQRKQPEATVQHHEHHQFSIDSRQQLHGSRVIGSAVLGVAALLFCWYFSDILLLTFAGILLALAYRGLAVKISAHSSIPIGWAVAGVIVLSLLIVVLMGFYLGPAFVAGIDQLISDIPAALERMGRFLQQYTVVEKNLENLLESTAQSELTPQLLSRISGLLFTAMGIFSTVIGSIFSVLVVFFVGVYGAATPQAYLPGVIRLIPPARRQRVREVFQLIAHDLQRWLVGRLLSMTVVTALTWIGLLLLGLPAALTLAVLAGLLAFIPNIGPVLALIPAVLTGLNQSPVTALYVLILYTVVQLIESYLITPLIQRRAVTLPPAFVIIVQLIMGVAFGFLGLLFATPLAVVIRDFVQKLYVEDVLERGADENATLVTAGD